MRKKTNQRQIRFDGFGNMVYPGFAIKNEQGSFLCELDSQQILQFLTESDARIFMKMHPGLCENAMIVEYVFLIPEGGDDA